VASKAESKFWSRILAGWKPNWHNRVEFGKGGTPGTPDAELLLDGVIIPVELKVGIYKCGLDVVKADVRAEQILWHNRLWRAGGKSVFMVEVNHPFLKCVVVPGFMAAELAAGGVDQFSGVREYNHTWLRTALRCALWPDQQRLTSGQQLAALDFVAK